MSTHIVTNQALLYEDMKAAGYSGAMLSSREALQWLVTNGQISTVIPPSVGTTVQKQQVIIGDLLARGSFIGTVSTVPALPKSGKDGDYALVGLTPAEYTLFVWSGKEWVQQHPTMAVIGTKANLPTGLNLASKGYMAFCTDDTAVYVWSGYNWIVNTAPVVVDGFKLTIRTI